VSFAYSSGGEPVLRDLSLKIRPGETVALIGSSGSGKSTLLRVLLGFETPQAGTVLYDGQDLSSLDVAELRRQIGVVLQSGRIFAGSIFENIKGASEATLEDCRRAASDAGLDGDLELFPMGLHTPLTEGATTVSGGQRQRILIARALVKKPRILFMDEATSALDNRSQAIVTGSLERAAVTKLIIAHRLSTIRNADRIMVMERGQIVESGSYEDLIKMNGLFAKLARRQQV
jgi:ABC-type bacteriocin/lantibiotic exporter with double-glycine peptidase domain